MAGFVAALWLLTPWWGRRDLLLVRCYLVALWVALGSVLLGLFVSPHQARVGGRLTGAVWPIPATQVAHYAAVAVGLVVVLWFCGHMRGRTTLIAVVRGRSHADSHAHQDRAGRLDREPSGSRAELDRG